MGALTAEQAQALRRVRLLLAAADYATGVSEPVTHPLASVTGLPVHLDVETLRRLFDAHDAAAALVGQCWPKPFGVVQRRQSLHARLDTT